MRQGPATPHPGGPPPPDRPPAMVDQSPPQGSVPPQAQPPRQPQPQSPQPQRQMSTLPPPPQFAQPTWDTLVSPTAKSGSSHIIPPLDFERDQNHPQTPLTHSNTQLTTITERSYAQDEHTRGPAPNQAVSGGGSGPQYSPVLTNEPEDVVSKAILDWMPEGDKRNMAIPRNSQESYFSGTASRPDSKFTPTPTTAAMAASRSAPGALPSPADIRPAPSNVPPPASTPPVAAAPMRRATTDSPRPGVSPESKTPPLSSMGQRSPSMLTTQTSLRSDTAPYANDAMGSISTHYTQSMDTVGSGPRQPTLKLGPANVPPQEVKDLPPTPYSPPLSRESSGLVPVESPKDFVFDESGMIYMPPSASPPARPSRTNTGPPTSAPSSAVDSTTSPSSSSAPSTRETEARAEQIQRKQTAFEDLSSVNPPPEVVPDAASHGVRALAIGRRPSGARANPTPRRVNLPSSDFENHQEETTDSDRDPAPIPPSAARYPRNTADMDDLGADALAALSFAEHGDEAAKKPMQPPRLQTPPPVTPGSAGVTPLYPSSFASGKAAERKAKLEAQNAAAQAAISKPGRPSGGASGKAKGGWNESSDEEEDDEEDDDEDEDEGPSRGREKLGATSAGSVPSIYAPQPQQRSRLATGGGTFADYGAPPRPLPSPDSHTRASRVLPPIPGRSPTGYPNSQENQLRAQQEYSHGVIQSQSRSSSGQYDDLGRPRTYYDDAPQHMRRDVDRSGSRERPPAPPRQSIWTSVLDPNTKTAPNSGNNKDTFITLEPNQTMTKAFAPQGLLQAGIQDKEDRSAKRQEELARESGASLVNVPSKPPPPQTGLLGAITAHERDRKREGGVGAALTERERERRMAEERQRKIDELQRQQLEYAQSTGASVAGGPPGMYDMYGGGGGGGVSPGGHMMNPMMMNPMMTGNSMMMGNPMMMGGMMPYGGFPQGWGMPAQTPQQYQMMAAQAAAAEAYRNAMMSFSQAGSVAPSEAGGGDQRAVSPLPPAQMMGSPWGGMPGMLNPMMTGMSGFGPQGYAMAPPNFGGYDNLQPPAGPHARFSSYQSSPVNHGGNLEEPPSRQDSNESPANGQRAPRHGPS
jgi:CCR4-NOT transcriptional complex subunit CAF120